MNMTPEELLKPRWKVIADYPGNERSVGEIIYSLSTAWAQQELERQMALYPHLFKKLEWWEERKEEEMPEYVYWSKSPLKEITRTEKWENTKTFGMRFSVAGDTWRHVVSECAILPATEEEYLNQQK